MRPLLIFLYLAISAAAGVVYDPRRSDPPASGEGRSGRDPVVSGRDPVVSDRYPVAEPTADLDWELVPPQAAAGAAA